MLPVGDRLITWASFFDRVVAEYESARGEPQWRSWDAGLEAVHVVDQDNVWGGWAYAT